MSARLIWSVIGSFAIVSTLFGDGRPVTIWLVAWCLIACAVDWREHNRVFRRHTALACSDPSTCLGIHIDSKEQG